MISISNLKKRKITWGRKKKHSLCVIREYVSSRIKLRGGNVM